MNTKKQLEPVKAHQMRQTYRVSLSAKYLPATNHRSSRIAVRRAEIGRDPMRLVVSWDHSLDVGDNYAAAFNQYLTRQNWGGSWTIGASVGGYVAVCDDPQWGRNV
jgi:hypothetical protein